MAETIGISQLELLVIPCFYTCVAPRTLPFSNRHPQQPHKMHFSIFVVIAVLSVAFAADQGYYKTKYNVDLDEVLHSDRLLSNYFNCLTDKGTCTAAGLELKRNIPDALTNKCKRCSPKQKEAAMKALKFLSTEKPALWKELENKYDPEGKFRAAAKTDPELIKYNIKF